MRTKKCLILLTVTIILFITVNSEAKVQGQAWPMYQGNSDHTGYVPVSLNPQDFTVRWSKLIGTGKELNPVTSADGKVFVSLKIYFDEITSFFVLDSINGDTIWSKDFGSVYSVNPPSYAYGNVYIQTGNHSSDTYLRAYNADTGDLVFKSPHSAQWERYYAPTIFDGVVYVVGGSYGGMYAFDAFDGSQLWFTDLQQYDQWTPSVDNNLVYAYVGEYSPALYVADRYSGEIIFKIDDLNFNWQGWSMNLAPVLASDNSVFVIQDGRLIKFDTTQRQISWEFNQNFTGQPSFSNGVVYAISSGALYAVDSVTGDVLWSWEVPSEKLTGTMIVTDSHIFVSSSSNTYAVDLNTHTDVWSYPAIGHLSLGEDALYIASSDGNLTCIAYEPYAIPVAVGGGDRIEYSNVTFDASKSYDPDGYIISYLWEINHKENPAYSLTALGVIVNISDLKQGFYDVVLTVTDNEGFFSTDKFLLAVKGPEPQCEYTYEDVEKAYDTGYNKGYNDGKVENQAIYNGKSRVLSIPEVVINGDVYEWKMKRMGRSNIFKLINDFNYIEN